ncbi:MAG: hypothetical protein WBP59_12610 [Ilumatobacteraceae bacterium]
MSTLLTLATTIGASLVAGDPSIRAPAARCSTGTPSRITVIVTAAFWRASTSNAAFAAGIDGCGSGATVVVVLVVVVLVVVVLVLLVVLVVGGTVDVVVVLLVVVVVLVVVLVVLVRAAAVVAAESAPEPQADTISETVSAATSGRERARRPTTARA